MLNVSPARHSPFTIHHSTFNIPIFTSANLPPMRSPAITLRPRIRATRGDVILIGPGKADLLEAIAETGSIRSAAERIGMSYMRAWSLVRTLNENFREPLVERTRGGA